MTTRSGAPSAPRSVTSTGSPVGRSTAGIDAPSDAVPPASTDTRRQRRGAGKGGTRRAPPATRCSSVASFA
ncbi:MAG: hypothetical protein IT374_22515 [Polyangiaceae bacterium]|nr:hypothetical protein [Polyangiaceae bacterium]